MKVLAILSVLVLKALSNNLPSSFMVCDHFGPNVNECLTKAINSALVQLKNGCKLMWRVFANNTYCRDLRIDLPSIEPLRSESNIIAAKSDVCFSLYNLTLYNASNTVVTDLKSNVTEESIWLAANFSAMDFTAIANYSVHGQLLFLHLDSEGKAVVNFKETIFRASIKGDVVNNRFKLNKFAVNTYPKGLKVDLQNIIRGQKKFSDDVNRVINDLFRMLPPSNRCSSEVQEFATGYIRAL